MGYHLFVCSSEQGAFLIPVLGFGDDVGDSRLRPAIIRKVRSAIWIYVLRTQEHFSRFRISNSH